MLIKKKYFVLLVTLLLVLLLGCCTTSLGFTFDDFIEYTQQLYDSTNNATYKGTYSTILQYKNNISAAIPSGSTSILVINRDGAGWIDIRVKTDTFSVRTYDSSSIQFNGNQNTTQLRLNRTTGNITNGGSSVTLSSITASNVYGFLNSTLSDNDIPSTFDLQNNYIPPILIYFLPNFDSKGTTGGGYDLNYIKHGYVGWPWDLGEMVGFDDLYEYEFRFTNTSTGIEYGSIFAYPSGDIYTANNALVKMGDNIYVKERYITYGQRYWLNIVKYTDRNTFTEENHYYEFYPINAVIENGVVINSGSGDYNIQNSTNDIINSITNEGETDDVLNEYLPSGDITNIASSNFQFTLLDNPFSTFLWHLLDSVYGALVDRGNVKLEANYKTMHFELNSSDFTLPDSDIKTFIRTVLIFLYIYGNYKYFHYLISLLETANIDRVIAELGTDEFYDSDIM